MSLINLSFAGAGRVAGALCRELFSRGVSILQVVSETAHDGRALSDACNAEWSAKLTFSDNNDIIIVAVPDQRLPGVLSEIKCNPRCIVAHTAGSFGIEVFPASIKRAGVLYPLQTFSKGRIIRFDDLPFLLEASDPGVADKLQEIVALTGGKSYFLEAGKKKMAHLSAVFANNFTNFMFTAAGEIAARAGISFDLLVPLVQETVAKALEIGPGSSQTGPAIRNDHVTIKRHIELLSFSPELQVLYREISRSIIEYYKQVDND